MMEKLMIGLSFDRSPAVGFIHSSAIHAGDPLVSVFA